MQLRGRTFSTREFILQFGLFVALIFLVGYFSFNSPYFFTAGNFSNILLQVAVVGMIAIGQTFVIVAGGIDLSVGSVIGLTGVAAAAVARRPDAGLLLPLLTAMLVGGAAGSVNGFFIAVTKITPFVATLAALSGIRGFTLAVTGTYPISGLNDSFTYLGSGDIAGIPVPVLIFLALFALAYVFQQRTRLGRYVFAIGGNRQAASVHGIPIRRIEFGMYALSGAVAGLAGATLAARIASGEPNAGIGFELTAIAAVIIGGTSLKGGEGGVARTIVGILILGVLDNGLNLMAVPSFYQQIVKGVVIIVAVLMDQWSKRRI